MSPHHFRHAMTFLLSVMTLLGSTIVPIQAFGSTTTDTRISVYDNVVSPQTCQRLHEAASASGLGHSLFRRNQPQTVLEQALDEILSQLQDTHNNNQECFVEYWSRQEWRHIEAHADIDEHASKTSPSLAFRYPTHGHVLYLQVGTNVRGPTCVFTNATSGSDLLHPTSTIIPLTVVPAVQGRLLRFQGNLLHAVPRPTDVWFLPFVKGAPHYDPQDTWGRSVVLFNTWWEEPPSQVPFVGTSTSKQECETADDTVSERLCHAYSNWQPVQVTEPNGSDTRSTRLNAKIWLLGNEQRRNHTYRTIKLSAPEQLRDALNKQSQPQSFTLTRS